MKKEFGVFNQFTGMYEKFFTIEEALLKQKDLLKKWGNISQKELFPLSLYIWNNNTLTQFVCNDLGNPIQ